MDSEYIQTAIGAAPRRSSLPEVASQELVLSLSTMETGVLLLGAFKLDQLQHFKLIFFQTFSTCLAFILGAHISYYPIYRKAEN